VPRAWIHVEVARYAGVRVEVSSFTSKFEINIRLVSTATKESFGFFNHIKNSTRARSRIQRKLQSGIEARRAIHLPEH
jgi:hypothetical protein